MIGWTVSHYRIVNKLGGGGMGEVYRAEDTNLNRQVAIKVLPDEFAHDTERLARFQREAQVLSSLNHPNIATLYGLEESGGKRFIVMELVEGQTLAQRLLKGPLPVDDALEVCRQIAEGLEVAHEKGVIHRDLKPANVQMTPDGKVKILDFGLARAFHDQPSETDQTHSPTITEAMTRPGVVLGTAAYMSPEQAKGKTVDKRADIWGFGCVLYECLTGKRTFQGETITETVASILKSEPDWALLPAVTPAIVRSLLQRCLQKDPNLRLHDIADARLEIAEAASIPFTPEPLSIRKTSRVWILGGVIAGLAVGAVAAALVARNFRPAPLLPVVRFPLRIESGRWLDGMRRAPMRERPSRTAMAVSGDGSFIVYSAIAENPGLQAKPQIYLRRMDQISAAPIPGTEGGISPFLSPDGRWVGFWEGGKLKKVPVSGGVPATLCDVAFPFGADWGPDNTIVFSSRRDIGLSRISGEGGRPEVLTVLGNAKEEYSHRLPHFLPGSRAVLFTVMASWYDPHSRLALLDLGTGKWRVVVEDAADGRYVHTGHLVFLRQGTLMAVAFSLERLEARGQPVPVVANVMQALNDAYDLYCTAAGQYSVSESGWLAYVPGGILPDLESSLVRVDQKGNVQPVADSNVPLVDGLRFSPDGRRIAYRTQGMDKLVWIYDLNSGTTSRLTGDGYACYVAWTPDAKRVVFGWSKSGPPNLHWQPADRSSPMERLTTSDNLQSPGSFTPDGSTLAFVETDPETSYDILLLDMKSRRVTPFLNSKAGESWPEISPDGRWLAYSSDESGRYEVWVRPFPGPGGRWQISKEGGVDPIWSKDGRQLFYRQTGTSGADQVWVVDIRREGGFSAGKPRLLFAMRGFVGGLPIGAWDPWPDGRGFLMAKRGEIKPEPVTELLLVQNWFEELKRLVPTGK